MPTNSNFNSNSIGPGNTPITDTSNALSVQSGAATQGTSPTITSTSIAPASPIQVPTAPSINTGVTTNASIPTPQSIINQGAQTTPAEGQQNTLLNQLATLTGQQSSLATQQNNQENSAGVPALTKTVNDLTVQLQGLNDHATLLQNNASPGGLIQNTEQNNAQGRGITAAGLAPQTSADLRNNQIQQATISSQALTVKSALYAAQGSYTLAKDAADKAAQVAFDAETQHINYLKASLDAIQPQLNKEEKAQAALQTAQLNDRQAQIGYQREDFKTGQAAIADAMANNPSDTKAQYAAQQAMLINPNDPRYLQKVNNLVKPYATDLTARSLDQQLKQAQLRSANTTTALNQAQLANISDISSGNLQNYTQTTAKGGAYVNTDNIADAKTKAAVQASARQQGIPVLDKTGASKLQAIDDTRTNLTNIGSSFSQFAYPNAATRDTVGLFGLGKTIKSALQTDDNISSFKSWRTAAINSIQALAGGTGSGLRINQAEIDAAIHNDIPDITDTNGVGTQKIANLTKQLDSWESELLKPTGTKSTDTQTLNGQTYVKAADGLYYPQ